MHLYAEASHIEAMTFRGSMDLNGQGVLADAESAIEWCTKAIDAGNADAMSILGLAHLGGKAVKENAIMKLRDL